jgi:Phage integrase SAM-like domain
MNYHNEVAIHRLAPGTMKNYGTTPGYLSKFIKEKYYRNDILLCELNYKFLIDFESFLIAHEPKDHQRPLSNNGIMKHIERFRKMVNMASP